MNASDEVFTVESYLACCKETGLSLEELKEISMGMALDYQTDYITARTEGQDGDRGSSRKATQSDFNSF